MYVKLAEMNQQTLEQLTSEQAALYRSQAPHMNDQSDAYSNGMRNTLYKVDTVMVESTKPVIRTLTYRLII